MMENSWYSLEISTGWVLLTLVLAVVLAFFLYSKKGTPWTKNENLILGTLRTVALFLIGLLLLNPLLKLSTNSIEKAKIVLAVDDSESIRLRPRPDMSGQVADWLKNAKNSLLEDYEVTVVGLKGMSSDSLSFDNQTTNLTSMLHGIDRDFEGENLAGVVLVSDGIVNEGLLPQYSRYRSPIYSLALGDTTAPKDLVINHVRINKVAYQGNQYPVSVQLKQKGFDGETTRVQIREGNKTLAEQSVQLKASLTTVDFTLTADQPGLKRLRVVASSFEGESSSVNNSQDVYINVIEGKERVLILAPAPHPDISAIRKVLDEAANYESVLYIPGISEPEVSGEFDVVIEHQAFAYSRYPKVETGGTWYILGNRSVSGLRRNINFLRISQRGNQTDEVLPLLNENFSLFRLNTEYAEHLNQYPPLTVPFGSYSTVGPVEVLLSQGVGSVDTERPLMMYYNDGSTKQALTVGAGIWKWRMQEFGSYGEAPLFNSFILKTVQYLSIKSDKKRFNVQPRQQTFMERDKVLLDVEVYNEVYERIYGNNIDLKITNESGEITGFEFTDSEISNQLNVGRLPAGVYRYNASVTVGGQKLTEKGEFLVKSVQLESVNLQANHDVLRALSRVSDGKFYKWEQRNQLLAEIEESEFPGVIHTEEDLMPLINSLWLIGFIMLLLCTEWFLRKYWGAY